MYIIITARFDLFTSSRRKGFKKIDGYLCILKMYLIVKLKIKEKNNCKVVAEQLKHFEKCAKKSGTITKAIVF